MLDSRLSRSSQKDASPSVLRWIDCNCCSGEMQDHLLKGGRGLLQGQGVESRGFAMWKVFLGIWWVRYRVALIVMGLV